MIKQVCNKWMENAEVAEEQQQMGEDGERLVKQEER